MNSQLPSARKFLEVGLQGSSSSSEKKPTIPIVPTFCQRNLTSTSNERMTGALESHPNFRRMSSSMSDSVKDSVTDEDLGRSSENTFDQNNVRRRSSESSNMRTHVVPYHEHSIVVEQLKKELSTSHAEYDDSLEYERTRKLYYKSKVVQLTQVNSDLITYVKQLNSQYSALLEYTQKTQLKLDHSGLSEKPEDSEICPDNTNQNVDSLTSNSFDEAGVIGNANELHISDDNKAKETIQTTDTTKENDDEAITTIETFEHDNASPNPLMTESNICMPAKTMVKNHILSGCGRKQSLTLSVSSCDGGYELTSPPTHTVTYVDKPGSSLPMISFSENNEKSNAVDEIPCTIALAMPRRRSSFNVPTEEVPKVENKTTSIDTPCFVPPPRANLATEVKHVLNYSSPNKPVSRTRRSSMIMAASSPAQKNVPLSSVYNTSTENSNAHQKSHRLIPQRKSYTSNASSSEKSYHSSRSMRWIPPSVLKGPPGAA